MDKEDSEIKNLLKSFLDEFKKKNSEDINVNKENLGIKKANQEILRENNSLRKRQLDSDSYQNRLSNKLLIISVIVNLILVGGTIFMASTALKQSKLTEQVVELNRDEFEMKMRPYLFFTEDSISHKTWPNDDYYIINSTMILKNYGAIPARIINFTIYKAKYNNWEDREIVLNEADMVIPNGGTYYQDFYQMNKYLGEPYLDAYITEVIYASLLSNFSNKTYKTTHIMDHSFRIKKVGDNWGIQQHHVTVDAE